MAGKDQALGALIFLASLVIAIGYIVVLVYPEAVLWVLPGLDREIVQFWAVAIVVLIAFLAIMFIGAWIGWTMATTPPPKPIEELETEMEEKTEKSEEEQKPSEETKETTEKKTETTTETGTTKRRKKS